MTATSTTNNLDSPYTLAESQIADFQRDGHVLVRGLCSAEEIAEYRPILNAATERFKTENRPMEERDTYGKAFLQIMNLWVRDGAVKRYTLAKRFGKAAADLDR